jgi:5-methylcytosine-specific restriction endonuclease McrA
MGGWGVTSKNPPSHSAMLRILKDNKMKILKYSSVDLAHASDIIRNICKIYGVRAGGKDKRIVNILKERLKISQQKLNKVEMACKFNKKFADRCSMIYCGDHSFSQEFIDRLCKLSEIITPPKKPKPKKIIRRESIKIPEVKIPENDIKAFYESWEWKRVRYDFLKDKDRKCQCCGATPADGVRVVVDHIQPIRYFWQKRFDPTNLQLLCDDCNMGKGSRDETDWRNTPVVSNPTIVIWED